MNRLAVSCLFMLKIFYYQPLLCRQQLPFFLSVLLFLFFSFLINVERVCVCLCVLLACQLLLCCSVLKFCRICSAYWLSCSSLNCLAPKQVCVIVGFLSGLLAASWATLASLRVYETMRQRACVWSHLAGGDGWGGGLK